jgi:hypothetical protein
MPPRSIFRDEGPVTLKLNTYEFSDDSPVCGTSLDPWRVPVYGKNKDSSNIKEKERKVE